MKTLKTIALLSAFVVPVFFFSCSDSDDNGGATGNYFSYDGTNYKLDHGFKIYWGQWWGDGHAWGAFIMSDGIQWDENEGDFTGTGHGIFFELFSPNESDIAPGTYAYDSNDSGDPFTFSDADFVINFNIDAETGTEVGITGGTVKIEKSGSNYRFTIDVVAAGGKPVKGFYEGSLHDIDWEDIWKSEGVMSRREP